MSQGLIAQFFVVAAVVLIFAHRWAANRWLELYVDRYSRLPGRDWLRKADPDPVVEGWRRRRLIFLVPAIASFLIAMALLLFPR